MESDPQVLIALVAGIEKIIPAVAPTPTSRSFVEDPHRLPVLVSSSTGAIRTVPEQSGFPTGDAIIDDYGIDGPVLDAIASISVSHPSGQFVAVALEIDVAKEVAVLTIADTARVGPDLIAYLNGIWRLMGIMSNRCDYLHPGVELPVPIDGQPIVPITAGVEPWRTEFIKRVYRYRISHYSERFQISSGGLRGVVRQFGQNKERSGNNIVNDQIADSVYALTAAYFLLQNSGWGHSMTDQQWGDLICLMDGTVARIAMVLDDPILSETWMNELSSVPLRRVLGALITQHRLLHILLQFCHSPRSRPALLCKLTVHLIPFHPPVTITLPSTVLCWQSLIETVCGDNRFINYSWLGEEVSKIQQNRRSIYESTVHAVCALIAYLEKSPRNPNSQFTYLGLSALTCSACHAWIQSFNSISGPQYRTRGSNGSWRFPWAMPKLTFAMEPLYVRLSTDMATLVAAEYVEHWTSKGKLYSSNNCPTNIPLVSDPAKRRMELVDKERGYCRNTEW